MGKFLQNAKKLQSKKNLKKILDAAMSKRGNSKQPQMPQGRMMR